MNTLADCPHPNPSGLPLSPAEFSHCLLHLHHSTHLESFWSRLVETLNRAIPAHSLSLYFNYFEIRRGFWALHHQNLPGAPRPWRERRRVSPTPGYLRAHLGKKIFGTDELLSDAPIPVRNSYFRQVMQVEGWRSLLCLAFWERDRPGAMLVIRKTAGQGSFTRSETDFVESLYGHVETVLNRIRKNPNALLQNLSPCEKQVALAALEGLSNKEIARDLDKTEATVKAQLTSIFSKLQIERRSQLAVRLHRD